MRVLAGLLFALLLIPSAALAQADLTLSVSGVPADEIRGGNFTAQYSVHNQGPQDTDGNVVVTIALDNASIQSLAGGTGGTVNQTDDQNATVTYPSFPFGLTITNDVTIVTNGSGGDATVTISVATGNDSNPTNNTFTATVVVPTRPEGDLNGTVYKDVNKNGEVDAEDTRVEGVQISLNTGTSRTTDAEGYFEWIDLFRRPYDVTVGLPEGFTQVIPSTNPFTVNVEDGGVTTVVILLNDENEVLPGGIAGRLTIETTAFGTMEPLEDIRVYDDANDSGEYEAPELSTMTDAQGDYLFENLVPGTVFRVRAEVPAYAAAVDPSPANTDVTISPGANALVDYTYRFSGVVAGLIYVDNDADGMYTDGVDEGYIYEEDHVILYAEFSVDIGAENTGDRLVGEVLYSSLYPREYRLLVFSPDGWEQSPYPSNVTVSKETPFPDEIRIGMYERVNIRADAFYDLDEDGVKDAGEPPAPGIVTTCTSSGDCQGMTSTSDANGVISFFQVQPGTFTLDMTAPEGPGQFVAPANAQFQFVLNSGQDNVEMQVAVREPVNGLPYPDLEVFKTVSPAYPAPGDEVTFQITVTNRGQFEALEVSTIDTLSTVDFVSATTTQGSCDYSESAERLTCFHGVMAAGDTVRVDIVAVAPAAGLVVNSVTATTTSEEPNNENNVGRVEVDVTPPEITVELQKADHQTCTPDWEDLPVEAGTNGVRTTSDGNLTRFDLRLFNAHPDREEVLVVEMKVDGATVGEPVTITLPPVEAATLSFTLDTMDRSWNQDGSARTGPLSVTFVTRRGEAELDVRQLALTVQPQPLILVHGLWADASTWADWRGFASAAHPGWLDRVFAVNTMDTGVSPSVLAPVTNANFTKQTIAQNADALDAFIADVREQTGSCHVRLVAHSMGGLISRRFIHELMPDTEADERPLTDRLIMLGTPNEGSPCTDQVLSAWSALRTLQEQEPSIDPEDWAPFPNNVIELSQRSTARFNEIITDKKGLRFHLLAGNALPQTCLSPVAGDLVVEVGSALALGVPGLIDFSSAANVFHTSMTADASVFQDFVLPRLKRADASVPALDVGEGDPAGPIAAVSGVDAAATGTAEIHAASHVMSSGDAEFTVGTSDAISVMLFAPRTVTTRLLDPSGTVVWEVEAGSDEALGYFRTGTVEAPEAGSWRIEFASTSSLADQEANIVVYAQNPAFNVEAEFGAPVADIVPVVATVTGDGSAVVTAEAISETVVTAPLFDDGAHGDGLAGDGVYGGDIAVGAAGTVIVAVRATRDGESRRVQSTVEVVTVTDVEAPAAEIPDAFRLAGVYPNPMRQNGMLELDVPEPALVRVRLVDALGREAALLATRHLEAGRSRVPLALDVTPGVYLIVIETASWRAERKLVVVR